MREHLRRSVGIMVVALLAWSASACDHSKKQAPSDSSPAGSTPVPIPAPLAPQSQGGAQTNAPPPADRSIPDPRSFTVVNMRRREINAVIVIVGTGAVHAIDSIYAKATQNGGEAVTDASAGATGTRASISYVPVRLGDIRGFKIFLHLYALTADLPEYPLKSYVPFANGLILVEDDSAADGGTGTWATFAVGSLVASAQTTPSVGILGSPAFEADWMRLNGPRPAYKNGYRDDAFFPALKAVTKEILKGLRTDGTTNPPNR